MPCASSASAGRYVKEAELGSGTYGIVYMAKDRLTGNMVAIKRMNVSSEEEGVPATTIREVCLLKELQHTNIVRLFDVTYQSPKLTLVFELCEYDLKKFMDQKRPPNCLTRSESDERLARHRASLSEGGSPSSSAKQLNNTGSSGLDIQSEVKCIVKQLLLGIEFMHNRHVVHRDLKPQNLLMNANLQLKIADFGLARVDGIPVKKYSHEAVTLWYRAPDVILGSTNYGFSVDMWSVGCIFAEMVVGRPIFNGLTDAEQLYKIFKLLGAPTSQSFPQMHHYPAYKTVMESDKGGLLKNSFPGTFDDFVRRTDLKKLGEDGVDLLRSMLAFDPANRISATKALQHPFLCDYEVQYLVPSSIYNSSIVQSSSDISCAPSLSRGGGTTGSQASMASSSGATASISNPTPNTKQLSESIGAPPPTGMRFTTQDPSQLCQMQSVLDSIEAALQQQREQEEPKRVPQPPVGRSGRGIEFA